MNDELRDTLGALTTEATDPTVPHLDELTTLDAARLMNRADRAVPEAIEAVLPDLAQAVDHIAARLQRGGRLIYVGAGTAGRLGVLDASECPPTFNTDAAMVRGVIAGGERALTIAVEGAEDDGDAAERALIDLRVGADDCVVGISASGRTPYAVAAVQYARSVGAFTIGLSCNGGSALGAAADLALDVVVGPEVLTGSTRLKAGTAQKLVLNMLSTLTMVRLGKTYRNLMVDLRATNDKLRARSWRIVREATGAADDEVTTAMNDSDGEVKTAIAMLLTGATARAARAALEDNGGILQDTLGTLGETNES